MPVDFTLDDLTKKLETWRAEAIGDNNRLRRLSNQLGHDLRSPINYVHGFCNLLLLDKENLPSDKQIQNIDDLLLVVKDYLNGLSLIGAYVTRSEVAEKHPFTPIDPIEGSQLYLNSVDNLTDYIPFLSKMFENGPINGPILEYSPHIDSGLKHIVYSANKFFSPVRDCYRIDLDMRFLLKDFSDILASKNISLDSQLQAASFKEDWTSGVVSYLLNNVIDHSFDGVEDREKILNFTGSVQGDKYLLTVKDNGVGIDTNLFPDPMQIFEYRTSRRSHEGEHHGKGLYLVKEFVNEHGGLIEVDNNPKKGVTFNITMPIYPDRC